MSIKASFPYYYQEVFVLAALGDVAEDVGEAVRYDALQLRHRSGELLKNFFNLINLLVWITL